MSQPPVVKTSSCDSPLSVAYALQRGASGARTYNGRHAIDNEVPPFDRVGILFGMATASLLDFAALLPVGFVAAVLGGLPVGVEADVDRQCGGCAEREQDCFLETHCVGEHSFRGYPGIDIEGLFVVGREIGFALRSSFYDCLGTVSLSA